MKLLVKICTFFFIISNPAQAYNAVDYLNENAKIRKDIEKKLARYGERLITFSYNKKFAYCERKNGTFECQNQNIFCVIIPWHNGDYNFNYEVFDCSWIKYPDGYYKELNQRQEKQKKTAVLN